MYHLYFIVCTRNNFRCFWEYQSWSSAQNIISGFFFFFSFSTIPSFARINVLYLFSKIIDPWLFKNLFIAVLKTVWELCGSKQQFYFVYQFMVRNLKMTSLDNSVWHQLGRLTKAGEDGSHSCGWKNWLSAQSTAEKFKDLVTEIHKLYQRMEAVFKHIECIGCHSLMPWAWILARELFLLCFIDQSRFRTH